jgi:hypothetical protein
MKGGIGGKVQDFFVWCWRRVLMMMIMIRMSVSDGVGDGDGDGDGGVRKETRTAGGVL